MPELPEVETVKEGLKKILKPEITIRDVVFRRKDLRSPLPLKAKNKIIAQAITNIERRAKYILIHTENSLIVSHLGMTGSWRVELSKKALRTHDHVLLGLSDDSFLIYNDARRFGLFDIIDQESLKTDKRFSLLGPEPLSDGFNKDYLFAKTRQKKIAIKQFLMDQKNVVGVGNIYVCEALFVAGVSPLLPAGKLKVKQAERLVLAIQKILKQSIKSGGSSIDDYRTVDDKKGSFQQKHKVYGRKGKACFKCHSLLTMQFLSGRSTFWCETCQK